MNKNGIILTIGLTLLLIAVVANIHAMNKYSQLDDIINECNDHYQKQFNEMTMLLSNFPSQTKIISGLLS